MPQRMERLRETAETREIKTLLGLLQPMEELHRGQVPKEQPRRFLEEEELQELEEMVKSFATTPKRDFSDTLVPDDEDDDPGRRQRQIANKGGRGQGQQEEEEEDEEQEPLVRVDPSDGYEGPEKPSKPPKVKETSSNHQIWKWVILVIQQKSFAVVKSIQFCYFFYSSTGLRKTPTLEASGLMTSTRP